MADKVRVRYVGSNESAIFSNNPKIPSMQFNRYGQLLEMDVDVFQGVISGKYGVPLAIMLDEDFQALNHTDTELSKFSDPRTHVIAPLEFKAKVEEANKKLLEIHAAARDVGNLANKEEVINGDQ